MKLNPSDRLMGNASLAHILADGCYGRMALMRWQFNGNTQAAEATYMCQTCNKIVESRHNKHG